MIILYSVSLSPSSDVSTQAQLVSACTHSLFLCVLEPVCAISLSERDLELHFANKCATSLPGDDEMEYSRNTDESNILLFLLFTRLYT